MQFSSQGKFVIDREEGRILANVTFEDSQDGLKIKAFNISETERQSNQKFNFGEQGALILKQLFDIEDESKEARRDNFILRLEQVLKQFKSVEQLVYLINELTEEIKISGEIGKDQPCNEI